MDGQPDRFDHSAFIVTIANEVLRFLDESINLGFVVIQGKVGMRSVVFSALLMFVVLFYRHGLMGETEFSWDRLLASKICRRTRALFRKNLQQRGVDR